MKAISLWQPWASLIAVGAKPFETRDWAPPRGLIGQRIAIHSAKRKPDAVTVADLSRFCEMPPLPLGVVVCTAVLRGAYLCGCFDNHLTRVIQVAEARPGSPPRHLIEPDEFGDYSPSRWAWALDDIEVFAAPIPARGAQGFWNWSEAP